MSELSSSDDPRTSAHRTGDFYRAMFEVNSAVKLLIDPRTGRIVDANQAAADLYGWPLDQLRQMRITDINLLTEAETRAAMENARTLRRRYFNFRHRTAGGKTIHVEVHSGPVTIDGEELLLSIVHDVTERDALEEQLQRAHRLESIGRLAGGVAHDFNNLLTVMMATVDLMRRKLDDDSPLRPHIDDLRHAASRAAELTASLLAFGRQQILQPAEIEPSQLIERLADLLTRTLPPRIALELELDPERPRICVDPARLEQVIMNLALNARDAMPNGGTLTLRTGQRTVTAGGDALPPGDWVTLEVVDDGEGMDEDTLVRVFEPFFTTKASGNGTGLGLATVYGVVRQSGGHISVSSTPGRGSHFTISLPRSREAVSTPTRPLRARTPTPIGYGGRLLLVEDEDGVRIALARALTSAGYEVIDVPSAEAALALPADVLDRIDVLVSDIIMSGTNGIELAAQILERRPTLPVLLMSGFTRKHDPTSLPDHVSFLAKPFDGATLVQTVGGLLSAAAHRRVENDEP